LTTPPAAPFIELGIATLGSEVGHWHGELEDVKESIAPLVCRAGGDAAIAFADGGGLSSYTRATIIKFGAGATPSVPPAMDGKCHYDTQCKGQRLCKQGTCVDP
jgi:hypothetical protein